jgi:hypothetical protein
MLFGQNVGQTIYAIPLWEMLFVRVPTVSRIIEFGTYNGGFSCYLKLCAMRFWVPLYSFDVRPFERTKLTDALSLEGSFTSCDVLAAEEHIAGLINHPGRTILYCDNGNKPAEFRMYAKHLKVGDVIGAHDWSTEIRDEDVAVAVEENNLQHIPLGEHLERGAFTKFFMRAAPGPRKDAVAMPEGVEWKTGPMRIA